MSKPEKVTIYERMVQRYAQGELPWDADEPPPEVVALLASLPPGRALDLGCGYGRASIYMARLGWQVDGIDFVPQALAVARERAAAAGISVRFHLASVARLDFLQPPYDFALDVGCAHALTPDELVAYRDGLIRLLRAGAPYLLYARLAVPAEAAVEGPPALPEEQILALFAQGFELERAERGVTEMASGSTWSSGWFWFRRG